MTKKDYIAIAEILKDAAPAAGMDAQWSVGCDSAREFIARRLCVVFAADNCRFDQKRFLDAAELWL